MTVSRVRLAAGIVTLGLVGAIAPTMSAWAGTAQVTSVHQLADTTTTTTTGPTKGSNPNSQLCKTYRHELAVANKGAGALEKDEKAGKFGPYKKAVLASFTEGRSVVKEVEAALKSAPPKVRSAGAISIKFDSTEKTIMQKATTFAGFEKAFDAASQVPKLETAEKTLSNYVLAQCGSAGTVG
jgi:hypothetical protein